MLEELVAEFGEKHRQMISEALDFLDENEPKWGLRVPMSRRGYIRELVKKARYPISPDGVERNGH